MQGRPDLSILLHDLRASGVVRNALRIAGAAQGAGLATEIWVARHAGTMRGDVPAGVNVASAARGGWVPGRTIDLALAVRPLGAYLNERRPRIAFSAGNHMHVAASLAHAMSGHAHLWARASNATLRTPLAAYLGRPLPGAVAGVINRVNGWQYRRFDRIIAVSGELADAIAGDLGVARDRLSVIANGVDVTEVSQQALEPVAEPWLDGSTPVVLGAGRLSKQKNFADLIRAVAIAGKSRPLRLIILGDGPPAEKQRLERLAASLGISAQVKLTGFVANPYAYMARASVFAVSSLWEGASNVVIEALATGTPVVAYRCPTGIAEVVAREALVATGDVEGLARAILMQISQPRHAEAFKAQAARYSLGTSLEAYVDLFRKTLAAPQA